MFILRFFNVFLLKLGILFLFSTLAAVSSDVTDADITDSDKASLGKVSLEYTDSDYDSEDDHSSYQEDSCCGSVSEKSFDEEEADVTHKEKGVNLAKIIESLKQKGKSPAKIKSHLMNGRNGLSQNYLHIIKPSQFDLFAATVNDDLAVADLLIERSKLGNFAITDFIADVPEISPRLAIILTAPRPDKDSRTPLMALAMLDADFVRKLRILQSQKVKVDQTDMSGATAEELYNQMFSKT